MVQTKILFTHKYINMTKYEIYLYDFFFYYIDFDNLYFGI